MDEFVVRGAAARAPAPRTTPTPPSPILKLVRVPTGWISEADRQLKLKNRQGPDSIVFVEKPEPSYFIRGGRKSSKNIPTVFEYELFMVLKPHVEWTKTGGPDDSVCLNCFKSFKSSKDGQFKLKAHAIICWGEEYCEGLDLDGGLKATDRRRREPEDVVPLPYEQTLEANVLACRWLQTSGRPDAILDDEGLGAWMNSVTQGAYHVPGSKHAGGRSEIATLDEKGMLASIEEEFKCGKLFYSNEPFLWMYCDMWSSRSKMPFLGIESSFSKLWDTESVRTGVTLGLVYLPGRHGGEEIAKAVGSNLKETFPNTFDNLSRVVLPADKYDERTGLETTFIGARSDSGGGIPAAPRRMGIEGGPCYLHEGDLWITHAFCIHKEPKKLSALEKQVYLLVKKARECVSHFSLSNQRNEAYAESCKEVVVAYRESQDVAAALGDDFTSVETRLDDDACDAFLGAELESFLDDPDYFTSDESVRVRRLVSDVKTRCWSVVSMIISIVEQRAANNLYAINNPTFHDFTIEEYKTLCLCLGPAIVVSEFERFIEGEKYNTLSIARMMSLEIYDHISGDDIACPVVTAPAESEFKAQEDFIGVAGTFLSSMQTRAFETVTAPMPVAEAIAIILDPRIKTTFFTKMADRYGEEWSDLLTNALAALKARLVRAQQYDQARVEEAHAASRKRKAALAEPAESSAAALAEESAVVQVPVARKVKRGLSSAMSRVAPRRSEASNDAVVQESTFARDTAFFRITAHNDVEAYLRLEILDVPLYPENNVALFWDPIDHWKNGAGLPAGLAMKPYLDGASKKHSFLAAAAMAYHGGQAAAGRPERLFRDVRFLNGVFQQKQKPTTISRRSMLRKNAHYCLPAKDVVAMYVANHPNSRRPGTAAASVAAPSSVA